MNKKKLFSFLKRYQKSIILPFALKCRHRITITNQLFHYSQAYRSAGNRKYLLWCHIFSPAVNV